MKIQFKTYHSAVLDEKISIREGEQKVGEKLKFAQKDWKTEISNFEGNFVLLGVCEDIGPQANLGRDGAKEAFDAFLDVWLNMQNNRHSNINNCLLLGFFEIDSEADCLNEQRSEVEKIDSAVCDIAQQIFSSGKIPILIGGGHNNAFPLIKAYYLAKQKQLNVINLDPHADYRILEGRHSGNSFSYAMENDFLAQYGVIGLHKAYNSEEMLNLMDKNGVFYTFFDDYISKGNTFIKDSKAFINKINGDFGVELDLDAIANMPSSAMSPMGWTQREARQWLLEVKKHHPVYYHFPEGAPKWANDGKKTVGKLLSYLVNDVIAD